MKKMMKLITVMTLSMVMMLGLCVNCFALEEYTDGDAYFDFSTREIHIAPGQEYTLTTMIEEDGHFDKNDPYYYTFSIYTTGDRFTSKDSTFITDWKLGYNKVIIRIGKDETAKKVGLNFYIDNSAYHEYSTVNLSIVDPSKSDVKPNKNTVKKAEEDALAAFYAFIERHPEMDFTEILANAN